MKDYNLCLLGAVAGDVVGSVFEFSPIKQEDFPLFQPDSFFTDDTVLTMAVAEAILTKQGYGPLIVKYAREYPNAGYGGMFSRWVVNDGKTPYNSFGNGSAMRVSPVGWAFDDVETVLAEAERSAAVTHNHPEGVKGAQAVALSIFYARTGWSKDAIRKDVSQRFSYDLTEIIAEIRPHYGFDETCQGSVPQSIIAFLESNSVEDAIRKAVSLGGDADTQAAIAGAIAEAFYGGVPDDIIEKLSNRLPAEFWEIIQRFSQVYCS